MFTPQGLTIQIPPNAPIKLRRAKRSFDEYQLNTLRICLFRDEKEISGIDMCYWRALIKGEHFNDDYSNVTNNDLIELFKTFKILLDMFKKLVNARYGHTSSIDGKKVVLGNFLREIQTRLQILENEYRVALELNYKVTFIQNLANQVTDLGREFLSDFDREFACLR
jgi:hypothetical protein